jgi:hypothetical protein
VLEGVITARIAEVERPGAGLAGGEEDVTHADVVLLGFWVGSGEGGSGLSDIS